MTEHLFTVLLWGGLAVWLLWYDGWRRALAQTGSMLVVGYTVDYLLHWNHWIETAVVVCVMLAYYALTVDWFDEHFPSKRGAKWIAQRHLNRNEQFNTRIRAHAQKDSKLKKLMWEGVHFPDRGVIHIMPYADGFKHSTSEDVDPCACGPDVEQARNRPLFHWAYLHHALDDRAPLSFEDYYSVLDLQHRHDD